MYVRKTKKRNGCSLEVDGKLLIWSGVTEVQHPGLSVNKRVKPYMRVFKQLLLRIIWAKLKVSNFTGEMNECHKICN